MYNLEIKTTFLFFMCFNCQSQGDGKQKKAAQNDGGGLVMSTF
jgi:hypothetical protein